MCSEADEQRRYDWEQAYGAIERGELRLGREVAAERDIDLGLDY